eukprot:NODE_498_length_851_cov_247.014963_g440_i0.p3 GENE.NODE_498_length_851_cov_247.014963_g440_i0~~NODE_498_length_851_cov_247.014963_g440_i0.p3  ORF type:complete len:61 (-),score=11.00 NODE_498_length_851_cov_247.014963_g440_i0:114-296(-)
MTWAVHALSPPTHVAKLQAMAPIPAYCQPSGASLLPMNDNADCTVITVQSLTPPSLTAGR